MHYSRLTKLFIGIMAIAVGMATLSGCHSSRKATTSAGRHLSKTQINSNHPATAKLLSEADSWIGTPYKYAGTDRRGVDCSSLTLNVFREALAIALPRNSAAQAEWCTPVERRDLIAGDLVFFSSNSSKNRVGHVGLYVGDGRIIHASPSQGVVLAPLDSQWFNSHYKCSGRVAPYFAMIEEKDMRKPKKGRKSRKDTRKKETPAVTPKEPSITLEQFIASTAVKIDSVGSRSDAPATVAAAREKVLRTYRELPPDSVMTSFFE